MDRTGTFIATTLTLAIVAIAPAHAQVPPGTRSVLYRRTVGQDVITRLPPVDEPTLAASPKPPTSPIHAGAVTTVSDKSKTVLAKPSLDAPTPPTPQPADAPRDVITFAGGAVEISPPAGWQANETAAGREIRLVLTPPADENADSPSFDGIWICFHAQPREAAPKSEEVVTFLNTRVATLLNHAVPKGPVKAATLKNWPGARQEFAFAPARGNPSGSRAFHTVIGTTWGYCEIHVASSTVNVPQRNDETQSALQSLVLGEPQLPPSPTTPETQAAAGILGTWKAYRSRFRLYGDGRILIIQDVALRQPLEQRNRDTRDDKHRLQGQFQAQQDVLEVVWADGSKQNFRWRLQEQSLLLTDHNGQTNHLKRIYE